MQYDIRHNNHRNFSFHNQGDETITRNLCTIYFAFANAKYNGVIKDYTEEDIKRVAKKQVERGLLDYKVGGQLKHGINAVRDYIRAEMNANCNVCIIKDDKHTDEWLDKDFALGIGITINKLWGQDSLDGVLDKKDYKDYKGSLHHATNIIRRSEKKDGYIMDSYFRKNNPNGSLYKCDIKEVLTDIEMITKYVIF